MLFKLNDCSYLYPSYFPYSNIELILLILFYIIVYSWYHIVVITVLL